MAIDITIDALRPILVNLETAPPLALATLAGGSSPAFRIDLADGNALILRLYDDLRQKLPRREAYAASLLRSLDLPVTRYLLIDESLTRLPARFAITTHLPGVTAATLRAEPDIADAYRGMGGLLRQLHTIRLPSYGHFDATGVIDPVAANADHMRKVAQHAFAQFRSHGAGEPLAQRLEAIVATLSVLFGFSRGAVFAHDDLHPNNVLVQRDAAGRLRLSGLIDFGNARAADAVFDLAKTLFICEHEAPGSSAAILAGYGPIDHPEPAAALWVYTLVHRVVMWWWLRHVGVIGDSQAHPLIRDLEAMAVAGGPESPVRG